MKQTERVLYISVILIISVASLCSRISNRKKTGSYLYNADRLGISQNYIRKSETASNGCDINPNIILQDSQLDTLLFKDLAKSPGLIIKLNDSDCSVCVDSLYFCLNESFEYFTNRVSIIAEFQSGRELYLKGLSDKTGFNFYSIISGELDFPAAQEGLLCIFWIDPDLTTKHLFLPDKGSTSNTIWYLNFIRSRYLE